MGKYDTYSGNIPNSVIKEATELLNNYMNGASESEKIGIRNELYILVRGYVYVWVNSMSKRWHRQQDEGEVISDSWCGYYYALEHYKPGYSIAGHFYQYIRYYLLMLYAKENKVRVPTEELKEIMNEFPTQENRHFERLLTLNQFRDIIPDGYKFVWDHAMIMTLGAGGVNIKEVNINPNAYYALRKCFIAQIKLIFNCEGEENVEIFKE